MDRPIEIILLKQAEDFLDGIEEQARKSSFIHSEKQSQGCLENGLRKWLEQVIFMNLESKVWVSFIDFSLFGTPGEKEKLL